MNRPADQNEYVLSDFFFRFITKKITFELKEV